MHILVDRGDHRTRKFIFTALLIDRGYTPAQAASVFSLYGLTFAVGRFAGGLLLDYFGRPLDRGPPSYL